MLRTALTSISKVNKTDVETLRTSFGVSWKFMLCIYGQLTQRTRVSLLSRVRPRNSFRICLASDKSRRSAYKTRSTSLFVTAAPALSPSAAKSNFVQVSKLLAAKPTRAKAKKSTPRRRVLQLLARTSCERRVLHDLRLHLGLSRPAHLVLRGTSSLI